MSRRPLFVIALVVALGFALSWGAAAQGPLPPEGTAPSEAFPPHAPQPIVPGTIDAGATSPAGVSAPAVALGQPGTVFRYLHSLGYTETAYLEDSNHLNAPHGVATDGTNVWIADSGGLRALKFNGASGAFMTQIGKAGFRNGATPSVDFDWFADVAVDGVGNLDRRYQCASRAQVQSERHLYQHAGTELVFRF